jgi:pimeloyl-ACP methyl ester carboxylesterase
MRPALAAVLAVLASLAATAPASAALRTRACADFPGVRCATVRVPLDRTGAVHGRLGLRVARVGGGARGTLMYLSGGPGGAGVSEMLSVLSSVPSLRRAYRVIGFDQRGTGRSGLLRCPQLERDVRLRSRSAAARCARELGPRRRSYTTADSVADMEAIRRAAGARRLTLFGISYGTELALAYARAHPGRVARLALDSVVDPDDPDPFALAGFRAMAPSLRALCPAGCRGVSADPAADLARLVARLRARPARTRVIDPHGRARVRRIGPSALDDLMFDADYEPQLRAALPAAVRAALAGDFAPVGRLVRLGGLLAGLGSPREFSTARFAAICEEAPLPWAPGTPVGARLAEARRRAAALGPAAFLPFDARIATDDDIGLCLRWPDVPRAPAPAPPAPYPAVPALLLQGGEDLRTPPEVSARVAARIPGARRLVVPGLGHAVTGADPSGCGTRALLRFLAGRSVATRCRRVPTYVPAVPTAPARFRALPRVRGLSARVGRTASAVRATFEDFELALSLAFVEARGGGLRGGRWGVQGQRLVLDAYSAVPGVTVSAQIGARQPIVLRVGGSRAARGIVRLGDGRLRGRLGGRRVDVRLRGAGAAPTALAAVAAAARASAARAAVPVPVAPAPRAPRPR